MARIYVSVGSNIEPEKYIRIGISDMRDEFGALDLSPVYQSEAVSFEGAPFLNLVVAFDTELSILETDACLQKIEDQNQRDRTGPRFSSRTLDLDLLLYDEQLFEQGKLVIPRSEITQNAFVLKPLVDIAPDLHAPDKAIRYADLWAAYPKEKQPLTLYEMTW